MDDIAASSDEVEFGVGPDEADGPGEAVPESSTLVSPVMVVVVARVLSC